MPLRSTQFKVEARGVGGDLGGHAIPLLVFTQVVHTDEKVECLIN